MPSGQRIDVELLLQQSSWFTAITRQLVRDVHLAADVEQATWAAALQHAPATEDPRRLRSWLYVVARNFARRALKREHGRAATERQVARPEAVDESHEEIERVHRHKLLAEAVLALDEPYRSAIALRFFSELEYDEIAARQGITAGAARQRVSRGLALLRERLDRAFDGDRRAWCLALGLVTPDAAGGSAPGPHAPITAPTTGLFELPRGVLVASALGMLTIGAWFVLAAGEKATNDSTLRDAASSGVAALDRDEPRTLPEDRRPVLGPTAPRRDVVSVAAHENSELKGVVLDSTGRPLAGALVAVLRDEARPYTIPDPDRRNAPSRVADARTGPDGSFSFALASGVPYDVFVEHDSAPTVIRSNRYAGEPLVVRLSLPATLRVRVVRGADSSPVAHARLRGLTADSALHVLFEGTTDETGVFTVTNGAEGGLGLEVIPPHDPFRAWEAVRLVGGQTTDIEILLDRAATVAGVVRDEETGEPIAGARVGLGRGFVHATTTDADGRYEITTVPIDHATYVHVSAMGYGENWILGPHRHSWPSSYDLSLTRELVVRGRVLDPAGAPIGAAYVAVVGNHRTADGATVPDCRSTTTDVDGRFEVRGARRDVRHSVFVRARTFGVVFHEVPALGPGDPAVELGDLTLAPALSLRGEVVDEFGRPVADCTVSLRGGSAENSKLTSAHEASPGEEPAGAGHVDTRRGRTDDRGRFAFADLSTGSYRIVATCAGVTSQLALTIDASSDESARHRVVLATGQRVEGRVRDETGRPLAGVLVHLRADARAAEPAESRSTRADEEGRFLFLGLAADSFTLAAEPDRWNSNSDACERLASRVVGIRADDLPVDFVLTRGVTVSGRVVLATGAPGDRATVEAVDHAGSVVDATTTRKDGSFRVVVPPNSTVDLYVREGKPSGTSSTCKSGVHAGTTGLSIVLGTR